MNDRMSDMDALVELAARNVAMAIQAAAPKHMTRDYTPVDAAYDDAARVARETMGAALLAVGLPALLGRVEAAEGEVARQKSGREIEQAGLRRAVEVIADLETERDALAAKVARVEAVLAAPTMTEIKPSGEKIRHFRESDLRAALDASETP